MTANAPDVWFRTWLDCTTTVGRACPDPGCHIVEPDGRAGRHAWVIQAIRDAKRYGPDRRTWPAHRYPGRWEAGQ